LKPTVPANVVAALAQRQLLPTELRVALWVLSTQRRGQRYFSREVTEALGASDTSVRCAIARLLELGILENATQALRAGRELRIALDPAQWKPEEQIQ
jgi:DNA-binding GntR family transcriptional regulator